MLYRSEDQFRTNPRMLDKRRKAAQGLRKEEFVPELKEVLDFFEQIGLLLRRGALDEKWFG